MEELTYEQTIELEQNIKLKNEADVLYSKFLKNVKLEPSQYRGNGKFIHWMDEHNKIYFQIKDDKFYFICAFLHEDYTVEATPSGIFSALKSKNRGVEHLSFYVRDSL